MKHDLILKIDRVTPKRMLPAIRHNRRAIPAERGDGSHIDSSRGHLNLTLRGLSSPEAVDAEAKRLMQEAGIKSLRKDGVGYVEILFSLPADTPIDLLSYFEACTVWAETRFRCPVLSSDVHRDEEAPHAHVLLLPLVNGAMNGSKLIGYAASFAAHHDSFFAEVGQRFGLRRTQKLTGNARKAAARAVVSAMQQRCEPVARDMIWPVVKHFIERDPTPWMQALGIPIEQPRRTMRSMTSIFISPGKGPKREPQSN